MLSFANATGNLFNRLGKLGALIKNLKSYQGTQLTAMTDTTNGVVAQYNAEADVQAIMGDNYIGILSGTDGAIGGVVQQMASATVNRMVFRDNPRINQTLTQPNTLASLQEIIRQMKIAGATVLAQTLGAATTAFAGVGNGTIDVATRRPSDGLIQENGLSEYLLFTCNQDSYSGGARAGNESFLLTGTGTQSDVFAFNWPLGSNCQVGLNAIDGNQSNGSGNLLTNSGFTTWTTTPDVPNNWTLTVGTASVNTFQEAGITYDGSANSLKITGDGSTLTSLQQQFGVSSGTLGRLAPLNEYGFNVYARRDAVAAGAGILSIELIDSGGNVINDQAGTPNSFTIDLTTLTTAFIANKGRFRTPENLPSPVYLRMRQTTALSNGRSVFLDRAGMGLMTQAYSSGPFLCVHAGSIPFAEGDYATCQIANSRGSGGTLSTWQTLFSQFFPNEMIGSELLLPSSATPSISDGLIA